MEYEYEYEGKPQGQTTVLHGRGDKNRAFSIHTSRGGQNRRLIYLGFLDSFHAD